MYKCTLKEVLTIGHWAPSFQLSFTHVSSGYQLIHVLEAIHVRKQKRAFYKDEGRTCIHVKSLLYRKDKLESS